MRPLLALFLTLSSFSAFGNAEDPKPCTVSSGNNFWDLSSLSAKKDFVFSSHTGRKFTLNVCRNVVSETWNLKDVKDDTVGGFFRGEHSDMSIGSFNTNLTVVNNQPYLYMTDGSYCPGSTQFRASTAIRFICDSGALSDGSPQLVAQLPPDDASSCAYFVEWRTPRACATSLGSDAAGVVGVFFSILLVAGFVYVFGAFIYNRYVLRLRGSDQFSCISLPAIVECLRSFTSWCQDRLDHITGNSGIYGRPPGPGAHQWGSWGPGARNWNGGFRRPDGYGRLPEEEAIAQPRFSIEGDDEDAEELQIGQHPNIPTAPPGQILYNDIDRQKVLPPVPKVDSQVTAAVQGGGEATPTSPLPTPQGATTTNGVAHTNHSANPTPQGMDGNGVIRL
ncbi:hypothetical protein FRB99_006922 [Tulasnella sp. 403]|nr:hypothetical protein FRB99_006922 [Tulasnella sp. 403]